MDKKDDFVQTLPALIAGGSVSGSFSGYTSGMTFIDDKIGYTSGNTTLNGTLTSNLALNLKAPESPQELGFWSMVLWSIPYVFILATIIGPFLLFKEFKKSVVKNPVIQKKVFSPGLSIACFLVMILGWHPVFWPFLLIIRKVIIDRSELPRRFQLWQNSYSTWQKLYYCHRHGIVFNPETDEYFPPDQIREYLHVSDYE